MNDVEYIADSLTIKREDTAQEFGVVADSLVKYADGQVKAFGFRLRIDKNLLHRKSRTSSHVCAMVKQMRKAWEQHAGTECDFLTKETEIHIAQVLLE